MVCAEVVTTATRKMQHIEEKIQTLQAMKNALGAMVKACESKSDAGECPILDALDDATKVVNK